MSRLKRIDNLVRAFARRRPVHAGSLLITVFGDSISQHGNSVWLGSLIHALEPLGVNARQLRTSAFRLARDGWLHAAHVGRRSFYSLTDSGMRQYERAARRVYAGQRPAWDGTWMVVVAFAAGSAGKTALRRQLLWQGYGQLAPGVFARPDGDRHTLDEILDEQGMRGRVLVFEARMAEQGLGTTLAQMARQRWGLDDAAVRYRHFLDRFQPLLDDLSGQAPEPQQAFQARTLLIHEYRRIVLHDADLPAELLPANWPGHRAAELTAQLYRALHPGAVDFLVNNMESQRGPLPGPGREYTRRFGGVK